MDKPATSKTEMTDVPEILDVPQPNVKGGLILFKKPSVPVSQSSGSRLGLDKLAAIRRLRAAASSDESLNSLDDDTKRQRIDSDEPEKDSQEFAKPSIPVHSSSKKERNFRSTQETVSDTPDYFSSQLWGGGKAQVVKEKNLEEPGSVRTKKSSFDYPTPSIPTGAILSKFF